jgi:hypothetical protein
MEKIKVLLLEDNKLIDQFKGIHSKLGSLGANNIITQAAESIVKECRKVDTVGH